MRFLDRRPEMERLDELVASREGGLAVVHGRRRIGKTRLLLEWSGAHGGIYAVADRSSAEIQRAYLAEAIAARIEGFADVIYPDWRRLLERLTDEARRRRLRGPFVIDELPYLVAESPELASVLQRWIDHGAREARLVVAVAGSSQRMMQGLILDRSAPLYGRARAVIELGPIEPAHLRAALGLRRVSGLVQAYTAWGGVPRYWELAATAPSGPLTSAIERLVLDPLGPLHREPDRLLIEESPPAVEVRPLLDAIGAGAHRVSEIAARIGRPATSLARPLARLQELGLVRRETPFGVAPRSSKRGVYRIDDPFTRMWFRLVAPNRAVLVAVPAARRRLLASAWPRLCGEAWEELCRASVPRLAPGLAGAGGWGPAQRWWHGNAPEWDVVAESVDGRRLLLGEARWHARPHSSRDLERLAREIAARPAPASLTGRAVVRAVFVPETSRRSTAPIAGVHVVRGRELPLL